MDLLPVRRPPDSDDMTGNERGEIAELSARLFGLDGQTGGAIGDLSNRLDHIDAKVTRWDGAITLVRVSAGIIGLGGIMLIVRMLGA